MLLNQHLNLFIYLNQLQLIWNFFQNKQNPIKTSCIIITFSCWYFSDFIVLFNWVIGWSQNFIHQFQCCNFDFYSWKEIFFERISINTIYITISTIISKNKQSFDSLITRIMQFSYSCTCIIWCFVNHFVFVPINLSFLSST